LSSHTFKLSLAAI